MGAANGSGETPSAVPVKANDANRPTSEEYPGRLDTACSSATADISDTTDAGSGHGR